MGLLRKLFKTITTNQSSLMVPAEQGFVISDRVKASFAEPAKKARRGLIRNQSNNRIKK